MKYKAVVFDNDGTLLDGYKAVGRMFRVYKEINPATTLEESDFEVCYFMTPEKTWNYLGLSGTDIDYFMDNAIRSHLPLPFEGIDKMLKGLKECKLMLGINTSRVQEGWQRAIKSLGEETVALFDIIITSDQVENAKPAPDSMLLFYEKTNLQASEVLFVGDSIFDAQCAAAAGCDFALAAWGFHQEQDYGEKYRFNSPEEVLELFQK